MITVEQQAWLDHLNDSDKVTVVPYDPACEEKFFLVKQQLQNILGLKQAVLHRGASSLEISGQDEIDVYVPVPEDKFEEVVVRVSELFGKPRSNYPRKRARFVTAAQGKHIDVFVINQDDDGWQDAEIFYQYLLAHPDTLDEYRVLKENSQGKSTKAYYTDKTIFINEILSRAKESTRS